MNPNNVEYLGKITFGRALKMPADLFRCNTCGGEFWSYPPRQKCLRKEVKWRVNYGKFE